MGKVKILTILWVAGVLCGSLALYGITPPRGWAGDGENESVFSLDVNNERLGNVLDRMSKASGYEITVNEGWRGKIVSARLENVTLEKGLKAIMDELGRPSYLLIYDKEKKRVEIVLVPDSSSKSESAPEIGPSLPLRIPQQAVLPALERGRLGVRPSLRRMRERPPKPTPSLEKTLDHAGPEEGGGNSVSENKEVPDSPGNEDATPENQDVTPETRQERKSVPHATQKAPDSTPDSSAP